MFCAVFVLLISRVVLSLTRSVCVVEGIGFGLGRLHSRAVIGRTAVYSLFWCVLYCIWRLCFSISGVGSVHILGVGLGLGIW
jgi:hypothetical protein